MKYILLVVFSLTTFTQYLFQPYNLNFELGKPGFLPVGWNTSKTSRDFNYVALTDTLNVHSGKQSLTVYNLDQLKDEDAFGSIFQSIDALPYLGKKITYSANSILNQLDSTSQIDIFIKVYKGKELLSYSSLKDPIRSTKWTKIQTETEISPFATKINIGLKLIGFGNVSFDNVKLELSEKGLSNKEPFELKQNNIDKLNYLKEYYGLIKYFYPERNSHKIYHDRIFYDLVSNLTNENFKYNVDQILQKYYPQIDQKSQKGISSNYNAFLNKHIGAPNFSLPGFTSSMIKNIYSPDRQKDAMIFQDIALEDEAGKKFIFKAKVKYESYNTVGRALIAFKSVSQTAKEKHFYINKLPANNGGWVDYILEDILPGDIKTGVLGLLFLGEGKANFDSVEFFVVDGKDTFQLLTPNNSFEIWSNNRPMNWTIPNSVYNSGYQISEDETSSFAGKSSLRVESNDDFLIHYPEENTYTTISTKLGEIKFPNVFRTNNNELIKRINLEKSKLNTINLDPDDYYSRLVIMMDLFSQIDHFYQKHIDFNEIILKRITEINNIEQFQLYMSSFFKGLNESKLKIWNSRINLYSVGANVEILEGKAVVTSIVEGSKFNIGDIIENINGNPSAKLFKVAANNIPGSNNTLQKELYINNLLTGNENDQVKVGLKREGSMIELNCKKEFSIDLLSSKSYPEYMQLDDGIYYVNMSKIDEKFLKAMFDNLGDNLKALVFDARGTSEVSEYVYSYFIDDEFIKGNTFSTPVITKPKQKNLDYQTIKSVIPKANAKINAKLLFLIDHTTNSYTENIIGVGKQNNLITTIGTSTAGSQSEVALVRIAGDFNYVKSIMEVRDMDGKIVNGNIIEPDIRVEKTIENINSEFDDQLQKAIEIVKNLNN